jgi:hypothetical protein
MQTSLESQTSVKARPVLELYLADLSGRTVQHLDDYAKLFRFSRYT